MKDSWLALLANCSAKKTIGKVAEGYYIPLSPSLPSPVLKSSELNSIEKRSEQKDHSQIYMLKSQLDCSASMKRECKNLLVEDLLEFVHL